jgi:hypothetical protein
VARWNAAPTHDWSPAIGTALKAGYRWLDVYCAGWQQVRLIDLAAVDVHPQAWRSILQGWVHCRYSLLDDPQFENCRCGLLADQKAPRLRHAVRELGKRGHKGRAEMCREFWIESR